MDIMNKIYKIMEYAFHFAYSTSTCKVLTTRKRAPAGGENPQSFHPFVNPFQFLPKISGGQAEHPLMAAVRHAWRPLRARNAAIRGCSACQGRYRIGERMHKR
jgi:hypothetical protein